MLPVGGMMILEKTAGRDTLRRTTEEQVNQDLRNK
jgi:hypothetical protein